MTNYFDVLPRDKPFKGIQVVLSTPAGARIDVTVSDGEGKYAFYNVSPGTYIIKFYGGGYTSADYKTITLIDESIAYKYNILAPEGEFVQSNQGSLPVAAYRTQDGKQTQIKSGVYRLFYKKSAEGEVKPLRELTGNDYGGEVQGSDIDPIVIITLQDSNGSVYDTLTLSNVPEGVDGARGPGVLYIGDYFTLDW